MGTDPGMTRPGQRNVVKPTIYIRTDGNSAIASGHLVRCLAIARKLAKRGAFTGFILSDRDSEKLLYSFYTREETLANPYQIVLLNSDYREMDQELSRLLPFLASQEADCLLVDSYEVTPSYLFVLSRWGRVAYLDDQYAFDYPVDLVINYDLRVKEDFYAKAGKLLAGGSFAPLRDGFGTTPFSVYRTVQNILLLTGATDPWRVSEKFLAAMTAAYNGRPPFLIHVVVGALSEGRDRLRALAKEQPFLVLHEHITDMAELMAECDIAVSAGGTTLYELCATGIPSVSFSIADNQIETARAFDEEKLIPYAGDARYDENIAGRLVDKVLLLCEDEKERKERSLRMRSRVDGAGATRVAHELIELALSGKTAG